MRSLALVCTIFISSIATSPADATLQPTPEPYVVPGFTVRGSIEIPDIATSTQIHSESFQAFAQKNAHKYASCSDMVGNVRMADGRLVKADAVGNINTGHCIFHMRVSDTSSSVASIFVSTQHGGVIGRLKPQPTPIPSASHNTHEVERVHFTFQKIEIEDKLGKSAASDDWNIGAGPTPKPSPK